MKRLLLTSLLLFFSTTAVAQTIISNKFQFLTGPCTLSSGSGSPEGVVTGKVCDTYWRTDTGQIYTKVSGTGNTGWAAGGVSGSGTTNTVAKWQSASVLTDASITDTGSVVTVLPTGNVVFNNGGNITFNPTGNNLLPNTGYDINIGSLTNKFLSLHAAELWVETLVAQDTLATIGGRVLVAPTTLLTSDLASGATSISVKHNNLANGDRVYMEANAQVEFMAVTSGPSGVGPYTYTVTRNLDGSGANDWAAGDAILNTGQTSNGFVDLYSVRGVKSGTEIGPTIVGNVRQSSTYNDWAPRWAIGRLDGLFGYSNTSCSGGTAPCFGLAFGHPSATRVTMDDQFGLRMFASTSSTSTRLTLDAGAGLRFYDNTNDERLRISMDGSAVFDGDITVGVGTNQIRNSECRATTDDWSTGHDTGLTITFGRNLSSDWALLGDPSVCYINFNSVTPALNTSSLGFLDGNVPTQKLPVVPGRRYEASVYLGNHRTSFSYVVVNWYQMDGTFISQSAGNQCTPANGAGGKALSGYCRSGFIATAPSLAAYGVYIVATVYNGTEADPYTFWTRAYFGEAKVEQEELSEWTPAGITEIVGGIIKTDTISAREIIADTITANEIAANAITTSELNADSVTSAKIAANTIVAADIAASTITTTEIAANTIVAGDIAAGTITATEIATGTITADRLNVSSLSAVSANMGTLTSGSITGGTIDGATINAGSGDEVILNSSGITLAAGTGGNNKVKWTDGGAIYASGDTLWIEVDDRISLFAQNDVVLDPGRDGSGFVQMNGSIPPRLTTLAGSGTNRFVCHDNEGDLYSSGTTCDGSAPSPLEARVHALEKEVNDLKALVQQLLSSSNR